MTTDNNWTKAATEAVVMTHLDCWIDHMVIETEHTEQHLVTMYGAVTMTEEGDSALRHKMHGATAAGT